MYADRNFRTKKALKEAISSGKKIGVFQPNGDLTGSVPPDNGKVYLEGPHFPEAHSWYAEAWLEEGYIIKVK
jgi:hypothetical protein